MTLQNHYFVNCLLKCMWLLWGRGGERETEIHTGFWWGNLKGKKPLGRSRSGCEDNIKMDHNPLRTKNQKYFSSQCSPISENIIVWVVRDKSVGIATLFWMDGPGIESRCRARFSAPVQTDSGAHPASYTRGTWSLSQGVKMPWLGVGHLTPSSAEVKERVDITLRPLRAFMAYSRVNFSFYHSSLEGT